MPPDAADVGAIRAQLEAEQAYQDGVGIVPVLPTIRNPTLVVTATNDMTNPPSNQVCVNSCFNIEAPGPPPLYDRPPLAVGNGCCKCMLCGLRAASTPIL